VNLMSVFWGTLTSVRLAFGDAWSEALRFILWLIYFEADNIKERRRSHKTKNNYENEQYKHLPSLAADQRSVREVFPQITFKEHFSCA